jgi:hypothetical protein
MSEEFSYEEVVRRKLARIETIINHRTEYGNFEDEESQLLEWLVSERERLAERLAEAEKQIKTLQNAVFYLRG